MNPFNKSNDKENNMNKVDFGRDNAEGDLIFLKKAFLPTSSFNRVRRGQKNLILGRKGTGKTATCWALQNELESYGEIVRIIEPRYLSKLKMADLEKVAINSAEAAMLSWKYVFLVELCLYIVEQAIVAYGGIYVNWPSSIQYIRNFLAQNAHNKANKLDKALNSLSNVNKINLKLSILEVGVERSSQLDHDLSDVLEDLVLKIKDAFSILTNKNLYILVDRIDEIWEENPESMQLIIGLLQAYKELIDDIEFIKIVVFLRSDIFDSLKFHDSDKYHSIEEFISWNENDLKKFITLRMKVSLNLITNNENEIWQKIFPKYIYNQDSFVYLLKYTLMRPRDLIQLATICRDKAQNNGSDIITENDINQALYRYSEWKLKDLRDEYKIQFPFLEKVFLSIFYHKSPHISREDISTAFNKVKDSLILEYGDKYFRNLDNLLQVLYNIGFIGVAFTNNIGYSFLGDKVIIGYASLFQIHPAFHFALSIDITGRQTIVASEASLIGGVTQSISGVTIGGNTVGGRIHRVSSEQTIQHSDHQDVENGNNTKMNAEE